MAADCYEVLGVSRTATQGAIKKAYRALARKYHPDVNPGDPAAEARFKSVSTAFEAVGEPARRALYDEFGDDALRPGFDADQARQARAYAAREAEGAYGPFRSGAYGGSAGGFHVADLFDLFNRPGAADGVDPNGDDTDHDVALDLATALRGGEVSLTLQEPRVCGQCHGEPGRTVRCAVCNGRGVVTEERTLRVRIPAHVPDGARLRIPGEGARGAKGTPGDLHLVVRIQPHAEFQRTGRDLRVDLPVTVPEAITGGRVKLVMPDGSRVTVRIPPGSQNGQNLRLKGLGLGSRQRRGDVLARLDVRVPTATGPEAARVMHELKALYRDEVVSAVRDDSQDALAEPVGVSA